MKFRQFIKQIGNTFSDLNSHSNSYKKAKVNVVYARLDAIAKYMTRFVIILNKIYNVFLMMLWNEKLTNIYVCNFKMLSSLFSFACFKKSFLFRYETDSIVSFSQHIIRKLF
jgi:hypothetical protein